MTTSALVVFGKGWNVRPCLNVMGHVASLDRIICVAGHEGSDDLEHCVIHAGAVHKRDAHLIASAPEIYEALRGAIELLDDCEIAHPFKWDSALAKARGEQSL